MREFYILTPSSACAKEMACALREAGICCDVVRSPQGLSQGCGCAVRFCAGDFTNACNALRCAGLPTAPIFGTPDGCAFMKMHCGM